MKKTIKNIVLFTSVLVLGSIVSCKKVETPEKKEDITGTNPFGEGVFISNEGPFQSGTGTVDFYNRSTKQVRKDIFNTVNKRPLGNIVQSMELINDKVYIVVNNANKIEVVNANTFVSSGSISGLQYPRYISSGNNGKVYVSQWTSPGSIAVVDVNTKAVLKNIAVSEGPDKMLVYANRLFVVNTGGFGSDNIISVINTLTDNLDKNIQTGDNPNSIVKDIHNKIWVLCGGKKVYGGAPNYELDTAASTAGSLIRIDPNTGSIEQTYSFTSKSLLPSNLIINQDGNKLFFNGGDGLYAMDIHASTLPASSIVNKVFYSLGYDPVTKYIYGSDPLDYQSNGKIYRYSEGGTVIDNFTSGVIPGNFLFR